LSASAIALTDVKCHGHALGQDVQPTLHSRASPYYLVIHRSLSLSLLPRTHCRHLHAWTGVFEAWRTSCWYRHHSREQQPSGHIKIYFVALRYWVGRLRYGELREHDPCRQSAEFSPSVNCFIVCVYILAGYINGCRGAHTLLSFSVGVVGIVFFHHSDLASGYPFLSAEACILKDLWWLTPPYCSFV
jgi:hypothetical protein